MLKSSSYELEKNTLNDFEYNTSGDTEAKGPAALTILKFDISTCIYARCVGNFSCVKFSSSLYLCFCHVIGFFFLWLCACHFNCVFPILFVCLSF